MVRKRTYRTRRKPRQTRMFYHQFSCAMTAKQGRINYDFSRLARRTKPKLQSNQSNRQ